MKNKADWYTTTEAAAVLGVSIDTVRRMCADGRIKNAQKLAGRNIIPRKEVEKYLVPIEQVEQVLNNTSTSINTTLQN